MSEVLALRAVHTPGPTRTCADGAHILSGGADGVVALFRRKGWPTSAPLWARQCHDGPVTCVVLLDDATQLALTCGRDGRVLLHEDILSTSSATGVTTRAVCKLTGEVRCLTFDRTHKRIFIGGDSLRCLAMHDNKFDVVTYALRVPHPVVSLALSPCQQLLAVASGGSGGAVQVTTVAPGGTDAAGAAAVAVLPNVLSPRCSRDEASTCGMAWCRTATAGLLLLIPTASEVRVLSVTTPTPTTVTLKPVAVLHAGGGEAADWVDYTHVTAYPLTAHIFACVMATRDGVFVAKVDDRTFAATRYNAQRFATPIADVAVQRHSGDVVVALCNGEVSLLARLAPKERSSHRTTSKKEEREEQKQEQKEKEKENENEEAEEVANSSNSSSSSDSSSENSNSTDDDDDDEDLPRVVADLQRANAADGIDHDSDARPSRWRDEDPRHVLREATSASSRFLDDEADEASSSSDDDDGNGAARGGEEEEEEEEEDPLDPTVEAPPTNTTTTTASLVDYAFQVGATPVGEEGNCYLAYNAVGYIHSAQQQQQQSTTTTTVHFHDISQPAVRIVERGTVLMGTLSPVGAGFVIASPPQVPSSNGDDDVPCLTIYYRTFVALGAQADWRVRLAPGETVRCLAAGLRFLAVATSRYLRLFSLSGLELAVLSKYSRIVTMVGTTSAKLMRSYKAECDPLAVVYALGTGELYAEVLDVGARRTAMAAHPLPLTDHHHQLQWLGWSEDGPLHTVDTAGVVRMYTESWGGSWVPVYDPSRTDNNSNNNLWVWGVNDEKLFAYRAGSSGGDGSSSNSDAAYPAALATGLPVEHVSLCVPLTARGGADQTAAWDHLLRRQIRTDELKLRSDVYTAAIAKHDAVHDKKVLELFAAALAAQQTTRALDLATTLELRDNVEACARLANAQGHTQLMRKLLSLYEVRVKAKSKRRCTLPLEGSLVTERERDLMLRKLLVKEKAGVGAVGGGGGEGTEKTKPADKVAPSPPSSPPPPPPAPVMVAVVEQAPPRRHVTFDLPPTTTTTTATTTTATTTPQKAVNPFAKPASPSPIKSPAAANDDDDGAAVKPAAAPPRRATFVAKALPNNSNTNNHNNTNNTSSLSPSRAADTRVNSRDPFLDDDTPVTVDALLAAPAPQTSSSGDALRKRLRELDEDGDSDLLGHVNVVLPPTLMRKCD